MPEFSEERRLIESKEVAAGKLKEVRVARSGSEYAFDATKRIDLWKPWDGITYKEADGGFVERAER